jgi:hypothetical protein
VLPAARERLLAEIPDDALVLDVGGWAEPFPRADWVLDLAPYATRGLYGAPVDPAVERFTEATWVQRDICHHEPWPFADGQFDLVICAQTLEDVRDPIWVCHELARVGRAGFLEVPTRLAEQSAGVEGDDWAGWSHHHWICDLDQDASPPRIAFTMKHHVVHRPGNHLPAAFGRALPHERRVQALRWEGTFAFEERILTDPAALDAELRATVEAHLHEVPEVRRRGALRIRRR